MGVTREPWGRPPGRIAQKSNAPTGGGRGDAICRRVEPSRQAEKHQHEGYVIPMVISSVSGCDEFLDHFLTSGREPRQSVKDGLRSCIRSPYPSFTAVPALMAIKRNQNAGLRFPKPFVFFWSRSSQLRTQCPDFISGDPPIPLFRYHGNFSREPQNIRTLVRYQDTVVNN